MIKIEYLDGTRDEIITEQMDKGLMLIEDARITEGNFLTFGTQEEHAERFGGSSPPPGRLTILENEINALKGELATAKIRLDAAERKVSTLEKATVK